MTRLRSGANVLLRLLCVAALLVLEACVPPGLLGPPSPPFTENKVRSVLAQITTQGNLVNTIFCTGTLTVKRGEIKKEADITIVGKRDPFQVKMEITHPWGSPIANLLVDERRFTLVFFPEKQILVGEVKKGKLHSAFPMPLDPSAIWGFVRGYPLLPGYGKALSPRKGVIQLFDRAGILRRRLVVDLSPIRPRACYFPDSNVTQYFKSPDQNGTVKFAREVVLIGDSKNNALSIAIKNALFNPRLPRGVFQVTKPAGFKTVDLSAEASAP